MLNLSVTISWVRASLSWNLNGLCYGYLVQFLNNSTFKSVLDRYESKTKLPCKCQIAASCHTNVSQALYQTITNNKIKLLNCLVYEQSLIFLLRQSRSQAHARSERRGTLSLDNFTFLPAARRSEERMTTARGLELLGQQVFKNHNCNPFQYSLSLPIHVSFAIFCAIYSFLKCYERQLFVCFNQFDDSSHCSECWQISWYLLQANNDTVFLYYLISQRELVTCLNKIGTARKVARKCKNSWARINFCVYVQLFINCLYSIYARKNFHAYTVKITQ